MANKKVKSKKKNNKKKSGFKIKLNKIIINPNVQIVNKKANTRGPDKKPRIRGPNKNQVIYAEDFSKAKKINNRNNNINSKSDNDSKLKKVKLSNLVQDIIKDDNYIKNSLDKYNQIENEANRNKRLQ